MGLFDRVKSSAIRQEPRPVHQIPPQLQQFDASAYIASNPVLKQQFSQPTSYTMPSGSPGQTYMQRPGSGGNSGIPTPNSTPPPAQPTHRPSIDTNVPPVMPSQHPTQAQAQGQQQGQYSMVCSNSLTSPGVQDVYVVPFSQQQQQQMHAQQQHARRHSYVPGQSHMYSNSFPVQQVPSGMHYGQQPIQAAPALPSLSQVQQQARSSPREQSPAARRYSIQTDRSSPPAGFPSQLPMQRMNSISKGSTKLYQLPELQMQNLPNEPANKFIPRNLDSRAADRDEVLTILKPMNLTDYLTITGPEDITRHIPAIDRSEAAVSEFQHPDQDSIVGTSYPLMRKQSWTRPSEETFGKLLTWNGRRVTPYPIQTLGRLIRSEEDVAALADDFWLKPVHTATCAWLQAIDSSRYNGDYNKGNASRLVTTTSTSVDGIAENRDLDPSMLHFTKQFTLYPPAQGSVGAAKKEVVFFMDFVSPGVLTEAGGRMWEEGRAESVAQGLENRLASSYYIATRQVATTAKNLGCRAGALCDYENIVLFYFKGQPESFTGPESTAEVLHLKYTDPHARYMLAELVYRSMADMSERLNLGDLGKVVEANQQMAVKNFNLMWGTASVVR
ncbi:hypothetical protein TWF718_005508 [Orbilia javanica]|uniref:Uncharacterized protein n=1 Tax=Orbilia javanica TaxID=47235 RepID=A0AAN8MVA8_9PEZI